MAQHKTIESRRPPRSRRRRFARPERSLAAAAWLGVLTVLVVAVIIFLVELLIPTSTVRNFCELVFVNGQVSPLSPIYQQYMNDIERQDDLIVFPISLFIGGLVMGRLAPSRARRGRVLGTAAWVALAVILAALGMVWVPTLVSSHGRLPQGADTPYVLTLVAVMAFWAITFLAGAFGGLLWRNSRRPDAGVTPPAAAEVSAAR